MPVCSFARQVASGVHSKEESGEEKKRDDNEGEGEYSPSLYIKRIIQPFVSFSPIAVL